MLGQSIPRRVQILRLAIHLYRNYNKLQLLSNVEENRSGFSHVFDADDSEREIDGVRNALYQTMGHELRKTASQLCGAIVKAGQFLSLREELFPTVFTEELEHLQDDVSPTPFAAVRKSIEKSLGRPMEEVFQWVESDAVASGSLAQVHKAKLKDGRVVAIKILRPSIERLVAIDLSTLALISRTFGRLPAVRKHMDLVALHREFRNTLTLELDLRSEVRHMELLRETFADDSRVLIPAVIAAYTSSHMLVMEYVEGSKVSEVQKLSEWNLQRSKIRDTLLDVWLRQFLVTGFVHLDPHPGNLLILRDGRIAILDFGMVAEYTETDRGRFRNLAQRAFLRDFEGVAEVLRSLGYIAPNVNVSALLSDVNVNQNGNGQENAREVDSVTAGMQLDINTFRRLLGHDGFRLQAEYMLLLRCIGMLKTVLTTLTPEEHDWAAVLASHAFPILLQSKVS